MVLRPEWFDINKTILRIHFEGVITRWQEYHDGVEAAFEKTKESDHPVYIVFDAGRAHMPVGNPIEHIRRTMNNLPENVVTTVSVLDNLYSEAMIDLLKTIDKSDKMAVVNSWNAAFDYIQDQKELRGHEIPRVAEDDADKADKKEDKDKTLPIRDGEIEAEIEAERKSKALKDSLTADVQPTRNDKNVAQAMTADDLVKYLSHIA